jgi:predicted RNase H-like HicB family nuclease/predicted transcriptional regulator
MSTLLFTALVTGDQASGYHATMPDLPGLAAQAQDLPALHAEIRRLILERLQAHGDAGEAWPTPTPVEAIALTPGAWAMLVDVPAEDAPIRVNISLSGQLVQRLDAAAEARGMTRSGFITQAVRMSLGEQPRGGAEFDALGRRIQDELVALGRRINESLGPDSAFSRRMAEIDDKVLDGVRRAADNVSAAVRRREAQRAAGARPDADQKQDGPG